MLLSVLLFSFLTMAMPNPTAEPSQIPPLSPSPSPTQVLSSLPNTSSSLWPSQAPSYVPTVSPSSSPLHVPSSPPSRCPTLLPSHAPSSSPVQPPSLRPSSRPSMRPSSRPSMRPSSRPSMRPSSRPSLNHDDMILPANYVNGTWSPVAAWPISPIHMILLKTGKVLSYGKCPGINCGRGFYYDVWDPALGIFNPSSHRTLPNQIPTDLFCSGQVNIPKVEGEVLIMGGSQVFNGVKNAGTSNTQIFNTMSETLYLTGNNIYHARWYPSVTVLGNGNIVAQGGLNELRQRTLTPEIYSINTKTWRRLSNATSSAMYQEGWYYPRTFLSSQNKLVVFPGNANKVWTLDPIGQGTVNLVGTVPGKPFLRSTTATMFDQFKILIIQGGQEASIVDIQNPQNPTSVATGSLREPRYWANAVNLPNGEVLMVGGASVEESLAHAVRYAEIWNPNTGVWRVAAQAVKSRLYHSAAILLPDATVLVGGGGPPGPEVNMNAEIYEPPYLFAPDGRRAIRPIITKMGKPNYGRTIAMTLAANATIRRVSLIRFGSVTHSFNMEERAMTLSFIQSNQRLLKITFPTERTTAPPGWYMVFLVNDIGVPSVAQIVSLL